MDTHGPLSKVVLDFDVGHFQVKTVSHWEELQELLKLRHEIFHFEHHGRRLPSGLDIDAIDSVCEHLIIRDRQSNQIVGSYRLTSTAQTSQFYASHRFQIDGLLRTPGEKIELGRACIHPKYRNGVTLNLLWRGIGAFLKASQARCLFGSASIRTQSFEHAAQAWRKLENAGHIAKGYGVYPLPASAIPNFDALCNAIPVHSAIDTALPPLFRSYLKSGAKVISPPAIDPAMGSIDFLIVLSIDGMSDRMSHRYYNDRSTRTAAEFIPLRKFCSR